MIMMMMMMQQSARRSFVFSRSWKTQSRLVYQLRSGMSYPRRCWKWIWGQVLWASCRRRFIARSGYQTKRITTLEMSCPWTTNRTKKTLKYGPLRWELKQQYQGYEVRQCNIIMNVLGGWSRDLDVTMQELVGSRSKKVLQNTQKAVLSGSLNISRTFKINKYK